MPLGEVLAFLMMRLNLPLVHVIGSGGVAGAADEVQPPAATTRSA